MLNKIEDKLLGLVVALFTFLIYMYFSTLVTHAEFNEYKLDAQRIHSDVKLIKRAMCMTHKNTCPLLRGR